MLVCLLLVAVSVFAQKETIVKGKVEKKRNSIVKIFATEYGEPKQVASAPIGEDNTFCIKFVPEKPGFYAIADFRIQHLIYVKGGEEINIDLLEKKASLNGKNTRENQALYQWEDFAADIRYQATATMVMTSTYKTFFPDFTKFLTKIDSAKQAISSGDKAFDALLWKKADYDVDYFAIMFLCTPRGIHPERSDWPAFYNTIIADNKMTSEDVLQFPYGLSMVNMYANFSVKVNAPRQEREALNNKVLQGESAMWLLRQAKLRADFDSWMEECGKYLATDEQKARAEAIGEKLGTSLKGKPWIDFTCPDINGKNISLSDFKGKVIVVDVWATWCGPCKGEIPYLKKLEEEMHGKDVVFIGVSVDKSEDKQKWMNFVKRENLKGVQLLAADWQGIPTEYGIKTIPRFMVFDRKGYIVSESSPRPSSPQLKKMIESELAKPAK